MISDASDFIVDIREYDVPYHVRVMIDLGTDAIMLCGVYLTDTAYRYSSR